MDNNEFKKVLSRAIEERRLRVGLDQAKKAVTKKSASLVVAANNCPEKDALAAAAADNGIEFFQFAKDNVELGELCKKPFYVSAIAIIKGIEK